MNNDQEPLQIRPLQSTDYEQWLPLWRAYQVFYEVTLDDAVTRSVFERALDPDAPIHCAVAVQGERLVGLVHAVLHQSTWACNDFCYLEDLYVAPEIRGAGAGKRLIEWVQDFARQHNCARLYWHTHETNKRAQKLYDWIARQSGCIEYRMPL